MNRVYGAIESIVCPCYGAIDIVVVIIIIIIIINLETRKSHVKKGSEPEASPSFMWASKIAVTTSNPATADALLQETFST